MAYPKIGNKQRYEPLFSASQYVHWSDLSAGGRCQPRKFILIYYPYLLSHFIRKYRPKRIEVNRLIKIYLYKGVGIVQMTGIGAPNAVVVLEELIALGGREFVNVGSCGGLRDFGIFLCERAIRDEGTSYHYASHRRYAHPDRRLTERLAKQFRKDGIAFKMGTGWTIDAPYRETKKEIIRYRKEGVVTVDMEASALFTVAKARGVKMASAFVVSDILGKDEWDPQFDNAHVRNKLKKLLEASVECMLS